MRINQKNARKVGEKLASGLQPIWASWRYKYFEQPREDRCFICSGIAAELVHDKANLILLRETLGVIMLNRYPYTVGHLMIAPLGHRATLEDVDEDTLLGLARLVKLGIKILDLAVHPKGYNIGINQGVEAGAGLHDHLHIHVVPRWGGDTNFMTTIGETRVLSEDLDHMYERLQDVLRDIRKVNNK